MVLSLMPIGSSREEEAAEPGFAELTVVALTHAVGVEGWSLLKEPWKPSSPPMAMASATRSSSSARSMPW